MAEPDLTTATGRLRERLAGADEKPGKQSPADRARERVVELKAATTELPPRSPTQIRKELFPDKESEGRPISDVLSNVVDQLVPTERVVRFLSNGVARGLIGVSELVALVAPHLGGAEGRAFFGAIAPILTEHGINPKEIRDLAFQKVRNRSDRFFRPEVDPEPLNQRERRAEFIGEAASASLPVSGPLALAPKLSAAGRLALVGREGRKAVLQGVRTGRSRLSVASAEVPSVVGEAEGRNQAVKRGATPTTEALLGMTGAIVTPGVAGSVRRSGQFLLDHTFARSSASANRVNQRIQSVVAPARRAGLAVDLEKQSAPDFPGINPEARGAQFPQDPAKEGVAGAFVPARPIIRGESLLEDLERQARTGELRGAERASEQQNQLRLQIERGREHVITQMHERTSADMREALSPEQILRHNYEARVASEMEPVQREMDELVVLVDDEIAKATDQLTSGQAGEHAVDIMKRAYERASKPVKRLYQKFDDLPGIRNRSLKTTNDEMRLAVHEAQLKKNLWRQLPDNVKLEAENLARRGQLSSIADMREFQALLNAAIRTARRGPAGDLDPTLPLLFTLKRQKLRVGANKGRVVGIDEQLERWASQPNAPEEALDLLAANEHHARLSTQYRDSIFGLFGTRVGKSFDGVVMDRFLQPRIRGKKAMRAYVTAAGGDPEAMKLLENYITARMIEDTGSLVNGRSVIDPKKHGRFMQKYEPAFRQIENIKKNVDSIAKLQKKVDDLGITLSDAANDINHSAVKLALDEGLPATIKRITRDRAASQKLFGELNESERQGMRNALWDNWSQQVVDKMKETNTPASTVKDPSGLDHIIRLNEDLIIDWFGKRHLDNLKEASRISHLVKAEALGTVRKDRTAISKILDYRFMMNKIWSVKFKAVRGAGQIAKDMSVFTPKQDAMRLEAMFRNPPQLVDALTALTRENTSGIVKRSRANLATTYGRVEAEARQRRDNARKKIKERREGLTLEQAIDEAEAAAVGSRGPRVPPSQLQFPQSDPSLTGLQ